jgi:hypothetical protein
VACTDDECVTGACRFTANNANCPDNGQFCDGTESCNAAQGCVSSGNPCVGQRCDEVNNRCVACLSDPDCPDNGAFCNGTESCNETTGQCVSSGNPCPPGTVCDEVNDDCGGFPQSAFLDIKPGSCPNPVIPTSRGVLPVALVATNVFDISQIDLGSLFIARSDGVGGRLAPLTREQSPRIEDTSTPFGGELCDCHALRADGRRDLSLKFSTKELAAVLELSAVPKNTLLSLTVSGLLLDGTTFAASDCILIIGGR